VEIAREACPVTAKRCSQQFRRDEPWRQFLQQTLGSHVNSPRTLVLEENFRMANTLVPDLISGTLVSFSKPIDLRTAD